MSAPTFFALPPALQPLHAAVLQIAPAAVLVGGAVRDLALGRAIKDLDYVVPARGLIIARRVANALGGAFYPLDEVRETGRVVWPASSKERDGSEVWIIDVARWRGASLEADLAARDFTVNAIALQADGAIFDPLGGMTDLAQRRLRVCAPSSLSSDPLRILRGVRMLLTFGLEADPGLEAQVRAARPGLAAVSSERKRDEILALLALPDPGGGFRQMAAWELLPELFPELTALAGIAQPRPHVHTAYEHTLVALHHMARIDQLVRLSATPADASEAALMAALAPFQPGLAASLGEALAPGRARWQWLRFAALAHDWGKATTGTQDETGRLHFFGHEDVSAHLAGAWLQRFACATDEIRFVTETCQAHMRPHHLHWAGGQPSTRSLHHLYRDLGAAGVISIALLYLADILATDDALTAAAWQESLDLAVALIAPALAPDAPPILPRPLLGGREVMAALQLPAGPAIGRLLRALQEAQAVGEVSDREQALAFLYATMKASA